MIKLAVQYMVEDGRGTGRGISGRVSSGRVTRTDLGVGYGGGDCEGGGSGNGIGRGIGYGKGRSSHCTTGNST